MPLISSRSFKCLGQSVCLSSKNGPADTVTERFINWRLDVKTASQITQPSMSLILICCVIYDVVFIRSGVRKLTPGCFCKAFAGTSTESGLMAPNRSDKGWTNWSKVCNTCAVSTLWVPYVDTSTTSSGDATSRTLCSLSLTWRHIVR